MGVLTPHSWKFIFWCFLIWNTIQNDYITYQKRGITVVILYDSLCWPCHCCGVHMVVCLCWYWTQASVQWIGNYLFDLLPYVYSKIYLHFCVCACCSKPISSVTKKRCSLLYSVGLPGMVWFSRLFDKIIMVMYERMQDLSLFLYSPSFLTRYHVAISFTVLLSQVLGLKRYECHVICCVQILLIK